MSLNWESSWVVSLATMWEILGNGVGKYREWMTERPRQTELCREPTQTHPPTHGDAAGHRGRSAPDMSGSKPREGPHYLAADNAVDLLAFRKSARLVRCNRSLKRWPEPFPFGRGGGGDNDRLVSRPTDDAGDLTEAVVSDLGHIIVDNT
jgi:hypothetical protein